MGRGFGFEVRRFEVRGIGTRDASPPSAVLRAAFARGPVREHREREEVGWCVTKEVRLARMVLLRHTLADGSDHFDWMLECASGSLATWRVTERPDEVRRLRGERLADHRAVYLEHEGAVSGGRGVVRRVAAGECEWMENGAEVVRFRCRFLSDEWMLWRGKKASTQEASGHRVGDVWDLEGEIEEEPHGT